MSKNSSEKYSECLKFFEQKKQECGREFNIKEAARLSLTVDTQSVWQMIVNGKTTDPAGMSKLEIIEADDMMSFVRNTRKKPNDPYLPYPLELIRYRSDGEYDKNCY